MFDSVKDRLTFEYVLTAAFGMPGVRIDREEFLRKELSGYCPKRVVREAIRYNPARAGVSRKRIDQISKKVIETESLKVTAVSLAASIPSSLAAPAVVGAVTADIIWYFAHILRVVQKLAYLYGFPEFAISEEGVDPETRDTIMVFLGVMFEVQGASSALRKLADSFARHLARQMVERIIAKKVIYPVVSRVAERIGIRISKQLFADSIASSIPLAGGFLSGGLTLATFRPCCFRLQKKLMTYDLSDPAYYRKTKSETEKDAFSRELEALKAFGIKGSPLRAEYEEKVHELKKLGEEMRASGCSDEEIARHLHSKRRELGEKYKIAAPPLFREYIYYATEKKYGDPLGPSYEALSRIKTDQEIIDSACRPIKDLDDRLTIDGFVKWYQEKKKGTQTP